MQTSISIIVPTYEEVQSLPYLIDRINEVRLKYDLDIEMLIMDDNSDDGTEELIQQRPEDWITLCIRKSNRGLSYAVCDGLNYASKKILLVMDADLSHPPELIPELVHSLELGFDFSLGSRYTKNGTTSDDWGFFRWINSRFATLLALPLTSVRDPMSGFFALKKDTYNNADKLNPIGYKIGLELIVKCACNNIKEIPFHFENRKYGESKLTLKEQLKYIKHIRRLITYKYGIWSHMLQFFVVGGLGMIVNLLLLTVFLYINIPINASIISAIVLSMIFNFVLNRKYTFAYARHNPIVEQFIGFIGASSIGALINYFVTIGILNTYPELLPQFAAIFGIVLGSISNFLFNRFAVFRSEHYRV